MAQFFHHWFFQPGWTQAARFSGLMDWQGVAIQ
jgi:hypothetical protein